MRRWKSIFFYLVLALLCYGIAAAAGGRLAFAVFLGAAIFWELMFWKALLWPKRR